MRAAYGMKKKKTIALLAAAVLCAAAGCILLAIAGHTMRALPEQSMAERWSPEGNAAQISCFFSQRAGITPDRLEEFEHCLDSYLTENSVEAASDNPGARLWADTYSGEGKISLTSERATVEADAVGFGGDFFLFHPQELLYGNYFSGNDLNQDYCVIDEDAAWQLFGSSNVAGMTVSIGGIPYIVQGVIRRPAGRMIGAAGLDSTCVYVTYRTLERYGAVSGINHYEIVMPDPVKQFAYKYVKEQLGREERETEVVENSSRFDLVNCLKRIRNFDTRSMNGRAILYPYWENLARGYEDRVGLLLVSAVAVLVYPILYGIVSFLYFWRHKGWTFKDLWIKIKDRAERYLERKYAQRHKANS